jgi:hypothetical protein
LRYDDLERVKGKVCKISEKFYEHPLTLSGPDIMSLGERGRIPLSARTRRPAEAWVSGRSPEILE